MKNRILTASAIMFCFALSLQAQHYTYKATLDTVVGANGLIVDQSGRIWYQSNSDSIGIQILNADGTPASISPIFSVSIGGTEYSVAKGATGMNIFPDGNILVSCGGALYKINSQTGEGIARWPKAGIGRPAIDGSGNVYITKVVGPAPIWKLDQNLSNEKTIGDSLYVWCRALEVTSNGKDLYAGSLWHHVVSHYQSDDGVTYKLKDTILASPIITGDTPILKWDRKGRLWIGQEGGAAFADPQPMFVYDVASASIVDTLLSPDDNDTYWSRPRGLDFSLSGDKLYVIDFDTGNLQEWEREAPSNEMIDNFEDGNTTNTFGGTWQLTGGVAGTLAFAIADGGYNSSKSLHVTGKYSNWAGVETSLNPAGTPVDISEYTGVRFAVKAAIVDTVRIRIREQKRVDDGTYEFAKFDFLPTSDWTVVTVPFSSMVSSYTGLPLTVPFSATDITQIDFASFKSNRDADFNIDDLELVSTATSIHKTVQQVPQEFTLMQNYPNPFNPSTTIRFKLNGAGFTSLKVYDVLGKEVNTLVNEHLSAGEYTVQFNAKNLSSGMYFYQLRSGKMVETKKMLLTK